MPPRSGIPELRTWFAGETDTTAERRPDRQRRAGGPHPRLPGPGRAGRSAAGRDTDLSGGAGHRQDGGAAHRRPCRRTRRRPHRPPRRGVRADQGQGLLLSADPAEPDRRDPVAGAPPPGARHRQGGQRVRRRGRLRPLPRHHSTAARAGGAGHARHGRARAVAEQDHGAEPAGRGADGAGASRRAGCGRRRSWSRSSSRGRCRRRRWSSCRRPRGGVTGPPWRARSTSGGTSCWRACTGICPRSGPSWCPGEGCTCGCGCRPRWTNRLSSNAPSGRACWSARIHLPRRRATGAVAAAHSYGGLSPRGAGRGGHSPRAGLRGVGDRRSRRFFCWKAR